MKPPNLSITVLAAIVGSMATMAVAAAETFTFDPAADGTVTGTCGPDTPVWYGTGEFSVCGVDYDFTGGSVSGTEVVPPPPPPDAAIALPEAAEWINRGQLLARGAEGEWDHWFAGTSPCGFLRLADGSYLLYYVGAEGPRPDNEPKYRKLGAATSLDGIEFTKHPGNPVVDYVNEVPGAKGESGVFGCATLVEANGDVIVAFGGMVEYSPGAVHSSVFVTNCGPTGLTCGPNTEILSHGGDFPGSYDEVNALGGFIHQDGRRCWYYQPEVYPKWGLGLACGPTYDNMETASLVLSADNTASSGGHPVPLNDGTQALFLAQGHHQGSLAIRTAPLSDPGALSGPVLVYDWANPPDCRDGLGSFVVMADEAAGVWRMARHDKCWFAVNGLVPNMEIWTAPLRTQ